MAPQHNVNVVLLIINIFLIYCVKAQSTNKLLGAQSVKKELKVSQDESIAAISNAPPAIPEVNLKESDLEAQDKVVVISEKSFAELQADKDSKQMESFDSGYKVVKPYTDVEESNFKEKVFQSDIGFPESFKTAFNFTFGLSTVAILLIGFRIYRMRMTRAERKYGVQGDRSRQELTPLPISVDESIDSDEENQTLFEINRQQIRIL